MNRNKKRFQKDNSKSDSQSSSNSVYNASNSQVIQWFQLYSHELDEKHDRYERIFKISRDITIESKRLIFFLHTYQKESSNGEKILIDAESRLVNLVKCNFSSIIKEIDDLDIHQYLRAYTFGVQEFIEAFSFYHYLKFQKLVTFKEILTFIKNHFNDNSPSKDDLSKGSVTHTDVTEAEGQLLPQNINNDSIKSNEIFENQNQVFNESKNYNYNIITMADYVLGLNDLSGELMRYCINKISSGHIEIAFDICRFLSYLYVGMLSVGFNNREFNRKMVTVKQCLSKVELACYTVRVRGSEIPKHMIVSVLENVDAEDDINF